MIEMHEMLSRERVVCGLKTKSKRQTLQELAQLAAADAGLDATRLFDALMERERLGTTGVGSGIAIPHAKLGELDRVVGVFARLDRPVDFDSLDDEPVDLVFLLLAPDGSGADHLKALARVARMLRDPGLCDRLRGLKDSDAIFRLLTEKPESHAA